MKNKYLIAVGTLVSIATPITVISCSCSSKSTDEENTKETNEIKKPEETKEDLTKKEFYKSNVANIVGNKALFDITGAPSTEEIKKRYGRRDDVRYFINTFVDANFKNDSRAMFDWMVKYSKKFNYVKLGFKTYANSDLVFIGYKVKPNNFKPNHHEIIDIYDYGKKQYELESKNDPNHKMTNNFDEWNSEEW